MLAFIKTNYQVGDPIEVNCSEGVITGSIEFVNNKYIVLRQPNGKICGIAASDIRTFTAASPVTMVPQHGTCATQAPAYDEETDTMDVADEELQDEEIDNAETAGAEDADKPQTLRDFLGKEKPVQSADELTGNPNVVAEPKVVGHIDLERIDPRYARRKYFKPNENEGGDANNNSYRDNLQDNAWGGNGFQRQPYVSAKGRITYYNSTKRFGFIHDFASDSDLYFYIQQVADNDLYSHLVKGTKVVYTISRNNQGPTAECVHLPHTVDDLLDMAEDLYEARHPHLARGVLQHVLDVYPDNKDASDLMGDIESAVPQQRPAQSFEPSQYNPCTIYAEAKKAYLAKDYDKAEEQYLKAIEANEKAESCVKDLLTLYVSRYKQSDDFEVKSEERRKASEFLEKHRSLLTDNLTTKQFLALNYYLPIQDYDKFLEMVDEILNDSQISGVTSRKVFYLWQKGIALNKLGRKEEALELVEEGLAIAPFNRQLQNLRDNINNPEVGEGFSAAEENAEEAQAPAEAPEDAEVAEEVEALVEDGEEADDAEDAEDADEEAETDEDLEEEK